MAMADWQPITHFLVHYINKVNLFWKTDILSFTRNHLKSLPSPLENFKKSSPPIGARDHEEHP